MDLQEELIRVMNKAVQELELSWNPPKEPSRSKLDSWYFRSSRRQVDSRTSVPFFPDVHDQLVKTLSAPQSACVHSATQAIFSHVDGAEAHGYVCMPPCRGDCRSTSVPCNGQNHGLGYQPTLQAMQDDSHLASKAYSLAGVGDSALHALAVLQVFKAKLLEGGTFSTDVVNDLRKATDFALMATKRATQAIWAEPWNSC